MIPQAVTALVSLLALGSAGCAYRVQLETHPSPALIQLPSGRTMASPGVTELRWAPGKEQVVQVNASGYRPLAVNLRDREIRFGRFWKRGFRRPRGRVELILVPEHGPVGTWTEQDIP